MATTPEASNTSDSITINPNNQTLLSLNMSNITKLTPTTYIIWKLQVHAFVDGHVLADYLDRSAEIPPATVTVSDVVTPNPALLHWRRQDKLLYSALLGSITPTVQSALSRTTTSAEIWATLADTYGTKTIDEYLYSLTTRFDALANLDSPMEHDDQIEQIFDGLPDEYRPIVDQVVARDTSPTIAYVHERLLNQEAKLLSKATPPAFPMTANVATNRPRQASRGSHHNSNKKSFSNHSSSSHYGDVSQHQFQSRAASSPQSSPFRPWQPRANVAVGSPYDPNPWILDSGATHHMTSDLSNLSVHEPYTGGEDVIVAYGSPLPISHTGSKLLPSRLLDLRLNKILCVPDIHKNLISVYRLCNTNGVSSHFILPSFRCRISVQGFYFFKVEPKMNYMNGRSRGTKSPLCLPTLIRRLHFQYGTLVLDIRLPLF
ncbi:PREDICTED: uncharacterized protein LOC104789213 [Camelina sativa]|uniref:Uncharacterized protein LOC104789213 n=1 Tax=Camelina sativa TaxID=90675 RepID=A0ABM0ZBG4_CAMSA|nr:PREDICTED: uncharacterized protein LOC104789213 [Camelina sativa]